MIGVIIFFVLLTVAFQEINIKYKKYPVSCKIKFLPEREDYFVLGPSNFDSSPYQYNTLRGRKLELENKNINELKAIIIDDELGEDRAEYIIEDIYSTKLNKDYNNFTKKELIDIILNIEYDNLSYEDLEDYTFLDKIY